MASFLVKYEVTKLKLKLNSKIPRCYFFYLTALSVLVIGLASLNVTLTYFLGPGSNVVFAMVNFHKLCKSSYFSVNVLNFS